MKCFGGIIWFKKKYKDIYFLKHHLFILRILAKAFYNKSTI